jgi:hypothetical protein
MEGISFEEGSFRRKIVQNSLLVFACEALAREGYYELAKLHFHQNDRDLMGRELRFLDDFIDRLVAPAKRF